MEGNIRNWRIQESMGKRQKKVKEAKPTADYQQFRSNLEFIEQQITVAKSMRQRKEVTRLKLKKLIMQLSYGAQELERRRAGSQDGKKSDG